MSPHNFGPEVVIDTTSTASKQASGRLLLVVTKIPKHFQTVRYKNLENARKGFLPKWRPNLFPFPVLTSQLNTPWSTCSNPFKNLQARGQTFEIF